MCFSYVALVSLIIRLRMSFCNYSSGSFLESYSFSIVTTLESTRYTKSVKTCMAG